MTQDTHEQSAETEAAREFAELRWNDDADHELQAMCYCLHQTGTANGLVEDRPYAEVEWWQNKADDLFDSIDRRLAHQDKLWEKVMTAIEQVMDRHFSEEAFADRGVGDRGIFNKSPHRADVESDLEAAVASVLGDEHAD